jgi:hypothetical protein
VSKLSSAGTQVDEQRLAAELARVRWPLRPLLDACGVGPAGLAVMLDVAPTVVRSAARRGLSDQQADQWATRAGIHPLLVWGWAWVDAGIRPPAGRGSTMACITAHLRLCIEAGDLRPGDPVPTARELAAAWGVTVPTALRAVRVLCREGLVAPGHRGHRTLVARPEGRK